MAERVYDKKDSTLSLRRRTTVSRVPMELAPRVAACIKKIRDLKMIHKYDAKNIAAMSCGLTCRVGQV